jgi:hypothetical protein
MMFTSRKRTPSLYWVKKLSGGWNGRLGIWHKDNTEYGLQWWWFSWYHFPPLCFLLASKYCSQVSTFFWNNFYFLIILQKEISIFGNFIDSWKTNIHVKHGMYAIFLCNSKCYNLCSTGIETEAWIRLTS